MCAPLQIYSEIASTVSLKIFFLKGWIWKKFVWWWCSFKTFEIDGKFSFFFELSHLVWIVTQYYWGQCWIAYMFVMWREQKVIKGFIEAFFASIFCLLVELCEFCKFCFKLLFKDFDRKFYFVLLKSFIAEICVFFKWIINWQNNFFIATIQLIWILGQKLKNLLHYSRNFLAIVLLY